MKALRCHSYSLVPHCRSVATQSPPRDDRILRTSFLGMKRPGWARALMRRRAACRRRRTARRAAWPARAPRPPFRTPRPSIERSAFHSHGLVFIPAYIALPCHDRSEIADFTAVFAPLDRQLVVGAMDSRHSSCGTPSPRYDAELLPLLVRALRNGSGVAGVYVFRMSWPNTTAATDEGIAEYCQGAPDDRGCIVRSAFAAIGS